MINENEVKKMAVLAKISLSEKEIKKFGENLSAVLGYFKTLEKVKAEVVEQPVGNIIGLENIYRDDKTENFGELGRGMIMRNVPRKEGGQVKVDNVLER